MAVSDDLADRITLHGVDLMRLESGVRRKAVRHFKLLEQELITALNKIDPGSPQAQTFRVKRAEKLLEQVQSNIRTSYKEYGAALRGDLRGVSQIEVQSVANELNSVLRAEVASVTVSSTTITGIINTSLIRGAVLSDWLSDQSAAFVRRLSTEMRIGALAGEGVQDLTRRIRGRQVPGAPRGTYVGGIMQTTTRDATAIARTSIQTIANNVRMESYKQNGDIVKGVQALVTLDTRTSEICMGRSGGAWDLKTGRALPESTVTFAFPGPPPWHWNCLVTDTVVSEYDDAKLTFKRWYEGEVVTIYTSGKNKVTCTPNHPILTDHGWIAAGSIKEGDNVLCRRTENGVPAAGVHGNNVPTFIQHISVPAVRPGSMVSVEMPTTSKDFHGDGMEGKVTVVGANSFLWRKRLAMLKEKFTQFNLVPRDGELNTFPSLGHFALAFPGGRNAFGGSMGVTNLPASLLRSHTPPFEHLRLGPSTFANTVLNQASGDHSVVGGVHTGEGVDGLDFSKVQSNHITYVTRSKYSGHVYNLETDKGWYVANGIITHNCRTTLVPITYSWEELGSRVKNKLPESTQASMNGQVAGDLTYEQWLKKQPKKIQVEALGAAKQKLWRQGKIKTLRDLVDQSGRPLTVRELEGKQKAA